MQSVQCNRAIGGCGKMFSTSDPANYDGDALCKSCLSYRKERGYKVDEQIAERRRNRPPAPPKESYVQMKGGKTFISRQVNYRNMH